tara:strand:+ start:2605 stop:2955 length:351 start_codon:yes stop_codon:yes gene_type:complete
MKKTLLTLAVIGLLSTTTTQAGVLDWFGAGLKPVPYLKIPLVKLAVPVPSITVGPKAGTEVDGNVSGSGARVALPWISGGVRWPSLTLGGGETSVTIGPKHRKPSPDKKKRAAKKK